MINLIIFQIGNCNTDSEPGPSSSPAASAADAYNGDCPACLEEPLYPVTLACKHVYCFLCVKGVIQEATKMKEKAKCGICKNTTLDDTLLEESKQLKRTKSDLKDVDCGTECWFYEAGGDWWKYDKKYVTVRYTYVLSFYSLG